MTSTIKFQASQEKPWLPVEADEYKTRLHSFYLRPLARETFGYRVPCEDLTLLDSFYVRPLEKERTDRFRVPLERWIHGIRDLFICAAPFNFRLRSSWAERPYLL